MRNVSRREKHVGVSGAAPLGQLHRRRRAGGARHPRRARLRVMEKRMALAGGENGIARSVEHQLMRRAPDNRCCALEIIGAKRKKASIKAPARKWRAFDVHRR